MMSEKDEKALVQNLRKMLDETEAETDPRIRMRLRSARLRALETLETSVPWYARFPRWAAAGGLATALALVLTVSLWTSKEQYNVPTGQVEDLELLTTTEQLELYKDLDLLRWLETYDHTG